MEIDEKERDTHIEVTKYAMDKMEVAFPDPVDLATAATKNAQASILKVLADRIEFRKRTLMKEMDSKEGDRHFPFDHVFAEMDTNLRMIDGMVGKLNEETYVLGFEECPF